MVAFEFSTPFVHGTAGRGNRPVTSFDGSRSMTEGFIRTSPCDGQDGEQAQARHRIAWVSGRDGQPLLVHGQLQEGDPGDMSRPSGRRSTNKAPTC